jgi:hypothetical protein
LLDCQNHHVPDPQEYCREVETYLCRKNDGHLIRVVGPAFEHVCDWARQGIPLRVVFHGIDRYFERYYSKGQRRWPVRLEFCETDVLDVFDEWRRAVGVTGVRSDQSPDEAPAKPGAKPGLQKHLERIVEKLTALRTAQAADAALGLALDRALDGIESIRLSAKGARGDARAQLMARLRDIESDLLGAATASLDSATLAQIEADAARELAPFRERMADDTYRDAIGRSAARLVRIRAGLPKIVFD